MGQPVLFDDGGSTRIKQMRRDPGVKGKMDDLIEVDTEPGSTPQSQDFAVGPFTQMKITCLDAFGDLIAVKEGSVAVPSGAFPIALHLGDSVVLFSGKHRVTAKLVNRIGSATNPNCEITVRAIGGVEPIVEARHARRQRRYIISNSPPIDTIEVNIAGSAPTRTFTVDTGDPNNPAVPAAVYTMVILQ